MKAIYVLSDFCFASVVSENQRREDENKNIARKVEWFLMKIAKIWPWTNKQKNL